MKKYAVLILVCVAVCVLPVLAKADDFRALLDESDAFITKAMGDPTNAKAADACLKSYQLDVKAVKLSPGSYEANWKAARGARSYCWALKNHMVPGYTDECARYSKDGMRYAMKAMELEPNKVEGYFWYASCVGSYADGVNILTAITEGLKNKTQNTFEKSWNINEAYYDYCANLGLGEFWYVLPWPLKDRQKARYYLERFEKQHSAEAINAEEGQAIFGQLLLESKSRADQERGRALLEKAAKGRYPYYRKMALEALGRK